MMLVIVSLRRLEPIAHAILIGLWRSASGFRFLHERIEDVDNFRKRRVYTAR
jgi:hypothetical protein